MTLRFGSWGKELNSKELAEALATIGVYGGLENTNWPIATDADQITLRLEEQKTKSPLPCRFFFVRPEEWSQYTVIPSAKVLADAWGHFRALRSDPPRFALRLDEKTAADLEDVRWLQDQLEAAIPNSHYYGAPCHVVLPSRRAALWQWPLRCGFLSDRESQSLASELEGLRKPKSFMEKVTVVINASVQPRDLEILFLPGDLPTALKALEAAPAPIYAHLVAVVDEPGRAAQQHERILALTQAHALLVTGTVPFGAWCKELVRELSHDEPLDIAATIAARRVKARKPMLWSTTESLAGPSVSAFGRRVAAHPALQTQLLESVTLLPDTANRLGVNQATSLENVLEAYGQRIGNIGFVREMDGATVTVDLRDTTEEVLRRSGPPESEIRPSPPRYLQARVTCEGWWPRDDIGGAMPAFCAGRRNDIAVHIGPLVEGTTRVPEAFPAADLPETDEGGHMLTVVFFAPGLMEEPQQAGLFLPSTGTADPCHFSLSVPERVKRVEARLTVLYENRVYQTALLRGPVMPPAELEHELIERELVLEMRGSRILAGDPKRRAKRTAEADELKLEAIEFLALKNLPITQPDPESRSRFDAALVLNHAGGGPGALGVKGNKSAYIRLSDTAIADATRQIDALLGHGDWDLTSFKSLGAEGSAKLLRELAWAGTALYKKIVGFGPWLTNARRVQVIATAADARLPIEFVYDRIPPAATAKVCPRAADVLRGTEPLTTAGNAAAPDGSVGAPSEAECVGCPSLSENPASVVCPLGFWCTSRVIEWHVFSEQYVPLAEGAPFVLETAERRTGVLHPLQSPIVGWTDKVTQADESAIPQLKTKLREVTGFENPTEILDWKDWDRQVKELSPTLQLLLIHTEATGTRVLMELGNPDATVNPMRASINLPLKFLSDSRPIVLLLGCSTGSAKVEFQTVVSDFESCGAAITVSTMAEVWGPTAAKLAGYFVEQLGSLRSGQSFGDVMLGVRRKALGDGLPMVLLLRAHGDADWRLTR